MTYQFNYNYALNAWHLGYSPLSPIGHSEPYYELPGELPEGSFSLQATVYGVSQGAAVGIIVKTDDDRIIGNLGTWGGMPLDYTTEGGETMFVKRDPEHAIELRIDYDAEAGEVRLFTRTTGVWQSVTSVPVTGLVDSGLWLEYTNESTPADGYLTDVVLLPGLEPPRDQTTVTVVRPALAQDQLPGIAPRVDGEPMVYGLVGAPYGDQEFDIGKSVRWLEYFSDKLFVLDVNLGDPRYWIVNWAITFPDSEHGVTNINYFERPVDFRKEQFARADKQYHMEDEAWVLFVDGSEGLSFDNSSLPDDYDSNPFMSFIYREIARAEAASADAVVLPLFVFLRSDEIQNVTYDHGSNSPDTPSVLQPISVPYYEPYQGLKRMVKVSALRDPSFDWASLDQPLPPTTGPSADLYSFWLWDQPSFTIGQEAYGDCGLVGDTPATATHVAISAQDRSGNPQSDMISQLEAGDQLMVTEVAFEGALITFNVTGAPFLDSPTVWWVPVTHVSGTAEPEDGINTRLNFLLTDTPSQVKAQIVSYAYAHWQYPDIPPGQTELPPMDQSNDEGWKMRQKISRIRPIPGITFDTWPGTEPPGVPGPWAEYTVATTTPDFVPITDTPVTPPDPAAEGVKTPLYDCFFRLNMRDGVWYEGDASGNTPLSWNSDEQKWQTAYNPDLWPDYGVRAGSNPDYVEPPTPVPVPPGSPYFWNAQTASGSPGAGKVSAPGGTSPLDANEYWVSKTDKTGAVQPDIADLVNNDLLVIATLDGYLHVTVVDTPYDMGDAWLISPASVVHENFVVVDGQDVGVAIIKP